MSGGESPSPPISNGGMVISDASAASAQAASARRARRQVGSLHAVTPVNPTAPAPTQQPAPPTQQAPQAPQTVSSFTPASTSLASPSWLTVEDSSPPPGSGATAVRHRRVPSNPSLDESGGDETVRRTRTVFGRWRRCALVGQGYQGRSYAVHCDETGEDAVAKELRMQQIPVPLSRRILKACATLRAVEHPYLVKYLDCVYKDHHLYVVTELLPGTSVADVLHTNGPLPEGMVACVAAQMVEALAHLHAQKMLHGALHSGNVMVSTTTGIAKLTDVSVLHLARLQASAAHPNKSIRSSTIIGLPNWLAPEIVSLQPGILPASDVWALGCTCVEMLQGRPPFWDHHPVDILYEIRHGDIPIPQSVSPECRDFLTACLTKDYAKRPDAASLLRHPFIVNAAHEPMARHGAPITRSVQQALLQHYTAVASRDRRAKGRLTMEIEGVQIDCADDDVEAALLLSADPLRELQETLDRLDEPRQSSAGAGSGISTASLRQCIAAQERVISVATRLQTKTNALKRELQRARQRQMCTETAFKKASDNVDLFSTRVRVMAQNVARLQDFFLSSREGGDKLANVLYGKLSSDTLNGSLAGILEHLQGTGSSRKWRIGWFVLKDNFMFYFKGSKTTGAQSTTIQDIIYLQNLCAEAVPDDLYKRPHCFRVSGQVFCASSPDTMRDWISAISSSLRWFEKLEEDDVIKAARRAVAAIGKHSVVAISTPQRRKGSDSSANPPEPPKRAYAPVFGVPLRDLVARDPAPDGVTPLIVDRLIAHIIERGTAEVGIFRISGSVTEIEELKEDIEHSPAADIDLAKHSVHTLTGVLKAFLRLLPEPLMPIETTSLLADTLAGAGSILDADSAELFRWVLSSTDQHSRAIVQRISMLIVRITANSAVNKMNVDNLLTCLVPNLKIAPVIFLRAVDNYNAIFGDLPLAPATPRSTATVAPAHMNVKVQPLVSTRGGGYTTASPSPPVGSLFTPVRTLSTRAKSELRNSTETLPAATAPLRSADVNEEPAEVAPSK